MFLSRSFLHRLSLRVLLFLRLWYQGASPRACSFDRASDLVPVSLAQFEVSCINPAIYLLWRTSADDCSRNTRPTQYPCERHRRDRRPMPLRDVPQRVSQSKISFQVGRVEFWRTATPVVGRHIGNSLRVEPVRQQPGLHRAVADHARLMCIAPGNLTRRDVATNHREGRLKRIHVPNSFAALKQIDIEIGDATESHLAFFEQAHHLCPRILDWRTCLVGPMELV